LTVETRDKL